MRPLRICLIASSRFPVAEPFAGGLEAHTHSLARALIARGHEVSLFAAPGSDPALNVETLDVASVSLSSRARSDVGAPPEAWMQEHHAYLALLLGLAATGHERFDIVHNNSLHHLPIAMSSALEVPFVTTLHTPPTPWLESAMRFAAPSARFVAVSQHTAEEWSHAVAADVIPNGIDAGRWKAGPGGERAIWFGRLVPEKGVHVAIDAARLAGVPLDLAGPAHDPEYFDREIAPRLGPDVRYLGHLPSAELAHRVGHSSVCVVTPRWEEPYGLVAAESMACGTPVAGFARGGLVDVVGAAGGRLCAPDDVGGLASAIRLASLLPRDAVRAHAVAHCSLDRMVEAYERLYDDARGLALAA
ncbi:glycosyltransferase [Herbiconiux sp.]|uniref:glycosyltransferase n=1 Tax=Herbiconiux sp. TaxID=1871186 RepID=UPI0025BA56CA|nr:glycosyltransferase [Herbiconiux sp.]